MNLIIIRILTTVCWGFITFMNCKRGNKELAIANGCVCFSHIVWVVVSFDSFYDLSDDFNGLLAFAMYCLVIISTIICVVSVIMYFVNRKKK